MLHNMQHHHVKFIASLSRFSFDFLSMGNSEWTDIGCQAASCEVYAPHNRKMWTTEYFFVQCGLQCTLTTEGTKHNSGQKTMGGIFHIRKVVAIVWCKFVL